MKKAMFKFMNNVPVLYFSCHLSVSYIYDLFTGRLEVCLLLTMKVFFRHNQFLPLWKENKYPE